MNDPRPFDPAWLADAIRSCSLPIGVPLSFRAETGSTNADASEAAHAGAPHGALFVADHQTQGRGRKGRPWLSPPGDNLYASFVLRPTLAIERLPAITIAFGLAVAAGLDGLLSADVGIKWPNDVFIRGRKVAGILVEGSLAGKRCEHLVAGIGINVHQRHFDPAIASTATSLARETDDVPARHEVLLGVIVAVAEHLVRFADTGLAGMTDELSARDITKGRSVRIGDRTGVADGIEADGRLRVRVNGARELVHAGDVEILG